MKLTRQDKVFVALGLLSLLPILFIVIPSIVRTQNALTQADNTLREVDKLSENTKVKVADIQEVRTTDKPEPESDKINVTAQDNQLLLIEQRLQELDKEQQASKIHARDVLREIENRPPGNFAIKDTYFLLCDIYSGLAQQILAIEKERYQIAVEKRDLTQESSGMDEDQAEDYRRAELNVAEAKRLRQAALEDMLNKQLAQNRRDYGYYEPSNVMEQVEKIEQLREKMAEDRLKEADQKRAARSGR